MVRICQERRSGDDPKMAAEAFRSGGLVCDVMAARGPSSGSPCKKRPRGDFCSSRGTLHSHKIHDRGYMELFGPFGGLLLLL